VPEQPLKPTNGNPAYEPPDVDRPASAAPTEPQLERELPVGRDAGAGAHDPYAALRIADYRLFALAFLVAVIGGQVQTVAVGWEIYEKTGSALNLGWLGLVMAAPVFLLALPAGHVADTHSRRRIMICTSILSGLCALGLAVLSHFWSRWEFALTGIYALMFLGNAGATFGRPARQALMPQLVPPGVFANAVTWNSSIFETASMAGPAVGGFICAYNIPLAYVVTALCWFGTGAIVWRIPNRQPPRRAAPATLSDVAAGLRFVWRNKLLLGAMTLDLFAVLLGGVLFLLPIFAKRLGGDAVTVGWFRAAVALGAACMALAIAHFPPFRRAGRALLLSVCAFGAATIGFGLSNHFWLSFAMLVLVGAFDNVSVVIRHSLMQLLTPDHMRGRVAAINQIFIGSSNELGGLRAGVTAAFFGEVISVVAGGIGTILVVFGVASIWPQIARLGSLRDVKPQEDPEAPTAPHGFPAVMPANTPAAQSTTST
jgi:MFS family permease